MDMKNKEITLFINSLDGGGAERICTELANSLVKQGYPVKLLVLNLINSVYDKHLDKHIELINFNVKHARSGFFRILSYIKDNDFKSILTFNHEIAILLVILRTLTRRSFKIFNRNISTLSIKQKYETSFWHKYIKEYIIRILYNKVNHIVAQSNGMKNDLVNHYKIPSQKISVIYNPVSQAFLNDLENAEAKFTKKTNEILFVGRLDKIKGINYLLDAFKIIAEKKPEIILRIVGDGELYQELIEYTNKLGISGKVIFEPFNTNVAQYYLNAKMIVLTSLYEGFPNVLVESIAAGTPVVSFDCPSGPSEIIVENVNGLLVEYQNTEQLVDKILEALNKDWDRDKIIVTSKQYRIEPILKQYLSFLDQN
jgi:glycosyltransferase involved in cell wall biosynthesis